MYDFVQKALGIVRVTVVEGVVTVTGVNGKSLYQAIRYLWKTTRVSDHMFIRTDKSSFSFHSFFLPDVLFNINKLLERRQNWLPVRTLSKIRDGLMEHTWLANISKPVTSKLNYAHLNEFYLSPLDYQAEFFDLYDRLTQQYGLLGFLFAGAAGSGKTYSSLALAYCLEAEHIIVICPKNAVYRVWEETLKTKLKHTPSYYISASGKHYTGKERVQIFHYEDLIKALAVAHKFKNKKTVIILDESHNLNEISAMRTNLFIELCSISECKDIIELSGSPIKAMSKETIPLFRCIDPLFTEAVEERFKRIFRGDAGRATEILNNRLGLVSLVIPKERLKLQDPIIAPMYVDLPNGNEYTLDALRDQMAQFIKERTEYYRVREPENKRFFYKILDQYEARLGKDHQKQQQYKAYRRALAAVVRTTMYRDVREEIVFCNRFELTQIMPTLTPEEKTRFKDVKSAIKYVSLKIKGECLGVVIGGARMKCFTDLASQIDYNTICETTEKKTIVFTSYVSALQAAAKRCKEQELEPVLVYGATNNKLNQIIQTFEINEVQNPLIATFDSLSTAVPLVMCDVMLMINVPFRDYEMQQAISRVHRLGADTQIYVHTVFLNTGKLPNISTRSKDILEWSAAEVEKIIGIKSPYDISEEKDLTEFNVAIEGLEVDLPAFLNWKR